MTSPPTREWQMPELPEADAWRIRYRSEPGMLGHYPWSYTERKRATIGRTECETEQLYTADRMHEYGRQCAATKAPPMPALTQKEADRILAALDHGDAGYAHIAAFIQGLVSAKE